MPVSEEMQSIFERAANEDPGYGGIPMRTWIKQIMVWLAAAACGFAAALVICRWSGTAFGLFMWPVIAAGAGFVVAGVGFFTTEGKSEILYGICAAACLFCMIVQTAMSV